MDTIPTHIAESAIQFHQQRNNELKNRIAELEAVNARLLEIATAPDTAKDSTADPMPTNEIETFSGYVLDYGLPGSDAPPVAVTEIDVARAVGLADTHSATFPPDVRAPINRALSSRGFVRLSRESGETATAAVRMYNTGGVDEIATIVRRHRVFYSPEREPNPHIAERKAQEFSDQVFIESESYWNDTTADIL